MPLLHAAVSASNPVNQFYPPYNHPGEAFSVVARFDAGWDGSDLSVIGFSMTGEYASDTLAANPGGSTAGSTLFACVTTVGNAVVGASSATASIYASTRPALRIAGPHAANDSNYGWAPPYLNPRSAFFVSAAFDAGWDGGALWVSGIDAIGAVVCVLEPTPGGVTHGTVPMLGVFGITKLIDQNYPFRYGTTGTVTVNCTSIDLHDAVAATDGNTFATTWNNPQATCRAVLSVDFGWDAGDVHVYGYATDGSALDEVLSATSAGGVTIGAIDFAAITGATSASTGTSSATATIRSSLHLSQKIAGPRRADVASSSTWESLLVFAAPEPTFQVSAIFASGWDGGDVVVSGFDASGIAITETLPALVDGAVQIGRKHFQVCTGATKSTGTSGTVTLYSSLLLVRADAMATRTVRVSFTTAPRAVSPIAVGDVLNPATWKVTRLDTGVSFTVLGASMATAQDVDVLLLEPLASHLILHRVVATGVSAVIDGSALLYPTSADFFGLITARSAQPPGEFDRDIANPQSDSQSTNSFGGTLLVVGGDYATEQGDSLARKMALRDLFTPTGAFAHLPGYGFGLGERVKQGVRPGQLSALAADIGRVLKSRPWVEDGAARLALDEENEILAVGIKLKIRNGSAITINLRVANSGGVTIF